MKTSSIFRHDINGKAFEVWVTNGVLQYVIDGAIQYDIGSVSEFLSEAAKAINKPNAQDDSVVVRNGSIADNALENYENGAIGFDSGGTSPSINFADDATAVKIGGSGVGGSFQVDFGSGSGAEREAQEFKSFADDLLGKATATQVDVLTDINMGGFMRTVTVSTRDDDITQIKFKQSDDARDIGITDALVEQIAAKYDGSKDRDGNVSEGYTANQLKIVAGDPTKVDLGSQGVGGKEVWEFATEDDAQTFFTEIKATFGSGADRSGFLDGVIEQLADDMGASQMRDGRVSDDYEARQIRLIEKNDAVLVDLGNHKVGGKERYDFGDDLEGALKFIGSVRDIVGVEAQEGRVVDEFIYKISGGQGIDGSPTLVGNDALVEFIAEDQFGATMIRNGSVSESFGGGGRLVGDGSDVQLGPRGVGGKEVWDFATAEDAQAFIQTLDDIFG